MKVALVIAGSLLTGVAAAQGTGGNAQVDRRAELKAKRMEMKAQMLQKFDTNRDGTLDDAERAKAHEEKALMRFKKLDTDGNGVLSITEFKAGKQGMGRHARGGHGGKRGGFHGPRGADTK